MNYDIKIFNLLLICKDNTVILIFDITVELKIFLITSMVAHDAFIREGLLAIIIWLTANDQNKGNRRKGTKKQGKRQNDQQSSMNGTKKCVSFNNFQSR